MVVWPHKLLTGRQETAAWSAPVSPNTTGPGRPPGYAICGVVPRAHVLDCGRRAEGRGCVYDIESDPEERVNLNVSDPELLSELLRALERGLATAYEQAKTDYVKSHQALQPPSMAKPSAARQA